VTDILLISGLSGAGRSEAAGVLEDLGWYVVDNLPTSLLEKIVELASAPGAAIPRLALVAGRRHLDVLDKIAGLRAEGHRVRLLFLDASTEELIRRYDTGRRRHPLDGEAGSVPEAIDLERSLLEPTKAAADVVLDTTALNVHQLKAALIDIFATEAEVAGRLQVAVMSFGFKHGLPLEVDIVMDVRFLPNPHWEESLRPMSGQDAPVRDFVLGQPEAAEFLDRFEGLLAMLLPSYAAEGRSYLTVAIGCTGGRHRSVAITEELVRRLAVRDLAARAVHRDMKRA
jgi:RNase adapter protein RapZ